MDNAFIARYLDRDHRQPKAWQRPINRLLAKLRINAQLVPRSFTWGMANSECRMNFFHLATQVIAYKVPGDFVEVGCNEGGSSIVLQRILRDMAPERSLHWYDSFQGLPQPQG